MADPRSRRRVRCDQDWSKYSIVTPFMKVLEIESVVESLIYRMILVVVRADVVLDH
jgi:hypothetical protein